MSFTGSAWLLVRSSLPRPFDVEADGVDRDEDPQPPAVVRLALHVFEHLPGGLVDVQVNRRGVAGADRLIERTEQ